MKRQDAPDWRIPISATLDKELIASLDARAEAIGISRSALIRILLIQGLKQSSDSPFFAA